MKRSDLFTIPVRDYASAKAIVDSLQISNEQRELLFVIIDDHRVFTEIRTQIIDNQEKVSEGIFFWGRPAESDLARTCSESKDAEASSPQQKDTGSSPSESPSSSETQNTKEDEGEGDKDDGDEKPAPRGKKLLPKGKTTHHALSEEKKICPCCKKSMVKTRTRTRTVVMSRPVLTTETHTAETVHCESCNTTAQAEMPKEVGQTIGRYHYDAVAYLIALRYLYGMASYRLQELSSNVGLCISDSTQWHLFEEAASILLPFFRFLEKTIANAGVGHIDDTHAKVLSIIRDIEVAQEAALNRGMDPKNIRSGIHTTNLTAVFGNGKLVLFCTGLHHAGEVLAKILDKRTTEEQIIIMADALSANFSKLNRKTPDIKVAKCNSHAMRKFKEVEKAEMEVAKKLLKADHETSKEVAFFLRGYRDVFRNDERTRNMSPKERLLLHRNKSLPIMEEMQKQALLAFEQRVVEPNSDLGKVYSYLINHWDELTAFCFVEGAPIENNLAERMLKGVIRHRRNSLFFKNQLGAKVADIHSSILMTAKVNGLNPIEYVAALLTHQECWRQNPEAWLPWNFASTIARLQS